MTYDPNRIPPARPPDPEIRSLFEPSAGSYEPESAHWAPESADPPPRPGGRRPRMWVILLAAFVAGLLPLMVGFVIGQASRTAVGPAVPAMAASATATETVTATAPPAAAPTVTKTATRAVTPPVCTQALDLAEQIISVSGDAMGAAGDAMAAAGNFDPAGIVKANGKIDAATVKAQRLIKRYKPLAVSCRDGAS